MNSRRCPAKLNLLLNILGKRNDGFHELETVMISIGIYDVLILEKRDSGVRLSCNWDSLPTDRGNLAVRAAELFFKAAKEPGGVEMRLEKTIPAEAGMGGGSSDAAGCLAGLNEMHGEPLSRVELHALAAQLGSDVPFFLHESPCLATGRGEATEPLNSFLSLKHAAFLVVQPGFGVPTAWAYGALKNEPDLLNGKPGRADKLSRVLQKENQLERGAELFYNAFEKPVFRKYPWLRLAKRHLLENDAQAAMMTGSGSALFGLFEEEASAQQARRSFIARFGTECFAQVAGMANP